MSNESASREPSGLLSAIRGLLTGRRRAAEPQFAHPWTAYCPTRFKPCETARTDIIAEKLTQAAQVKAIAATARSEIAAMPETPGSGASESAKQPVKLRLVSNNDMTEATARPVLPALAAATDHDFQLAARLATVSALNRRVAPASTAKAEKRTGQNRPIKQSVKAKRAHKIEPPAVGRKTRQPAKIVKLRLTPARAERKQARVLKIA